MGSSVNQANALASLKDAMRRSDLEAVKRLVLRALKADCSDTNLGRAIRLSVMEDAMLPSKKTS